MDQFDSLDSRFEFCVTDSGSGTAINIFWY